MNANQIPVYPWLNKPAPHSPVFDRAVVPGPRFGQFIGHSHVYAPQPYPGAPAFAYEGLGLVERTPIGPATINRSHLWPFGPAPLFASLGLRTAGLGGLATGQFVSSSLIVAADQMSEPLDQTPENWVG